MAVVAVSATTMDAGALSAAAAGTVAALVPAGAAPPTLGEVVMEDDDESAAVFCLLNLAAEEAVVRAAAGLLSPRKAERADAADTMRSSGGRGGENEVGMNAERKIVVRRRGNGNAA